jgi:hypothetical protein
MFFPSLNFSVVTAKLTTEKKLEKRKAVIIDGATTRDFGRYSKDSP